MLDIPIYSENSNCEIVSHLVDAWGFELCKPQSSDTFALLVKKDVLQLQTCADAKFGNVFVDFSSNKIQHRLKYGGGVSEAIAKAVGIKKGALPDILDLTAGLGRDAFVLASLGCRVHMIERHPVIASLLEDGLRRAQLDPDIGPWIKERMTLQFQDSRTPLNQVPFSPDVVYIDPMFPVKKKSALVKKEMQLLQGLIGEDSDADELFMTAVALSPNRIVVKRPLTAEPMAGEKAEACVRTKNYRFDMYIR